MTFESLQSLFFEAITVAVPCAVIVAVAFALRAVWRACRGETPCELTEVGVSAGHVTMTARPRAFRGFLIGLAGPPLEEGLAVGSRGVSRRFTGVGGAGTTSVPFDSVPVVHGRVAAPRLDLVLGVGFLAAGVLALIPSSFVAVVLGAVAMAFLPPLVFATFGAALLARYATTRRMVIRISSSWSRSVGICFATGTVDGRPLDGPYFEWLVDRVRDALTEASAAGVAASAGARVDESHIAVDRSEDDVVSAEGVETQVIEEGQAGEEADVAETGRVAPEALVAGDPGLVADPVFVDVRAGASPEPPNVSISMTETVRIPSEPVGQADTTPAAAEAEASFSTPIGQPASAFEMSMEDGPVSDPFADAASTDNREAARLYRVAQQHVKNGNKSLAISNLQKIVSDYPKTRVAERAYSTLARNRVEGYHL